MHGFTARAFPVLACAGFIGLAAFILDIDVHIKDASAAVTTNAASPVEPLSELDVYYPGWYGPDKTDHLIKPSRAGFHTVPD